MAKRIDQVLYFSIDFDVDWTNNSCEQAIRMAKLQAKISGSWRSMRGLKAFCRIRSYIATARAHDVPVFTALRDAFLDSPGASQQPRDRIGQPTRSRTPLNGYPSMWFTLLYNQVIPDQCLEDHRSSRDGRPLHTS